MGFKLSHQDSDASSPLRVFRAAKGRLVPTRLGAWRGEGSRIAAPSRGELMPHQGSQELRADTEPLPTPRPTAHLPQGLRRRLPLPVRRLVTLQHVDGTSWPLPGEQSQTHSAAHVPGWSMGCVRVRWGASGSWARIFLAATCRRPVPGGQLPEGRCSSWAGPPSSARNTRHQLSLTRSPPAAPRLRRLVYF